MLPVKVSRELTIFLELHDTFSGEVFDPTSLSNDDWFNVIDLSKRHQLLPLLQRRLGQLDDENVPLGVRQCLLDDDAERRKRNLRLFFELFKVIKFLKSKNISAIPFKGIVLSVQAYGDPLFREFCDLDLLVSPQSYTEIEDYLSPLGYKSLKYEHLSSNHRLSLSNYFREYTLHRGGENSSESLICLDVHSDFIGGGDLLIKVDFSRFLNRLIKLSVGGQEVETLRPEDLLIYLSVAGLKDGWSKFRAVYDMAALINVNPGLDWSSIREDVDELKLNRPFRLSLLVISSFYPVKLPGDVEHYLNEDKVAKKLAKKLTDRICGSLTPRQQDISLLAGGFWLKLFALDYGRYRIQYLLSIPTRMLKLVFAVNNEDVNFLKLPSSLSSLYFIVRIMRILTEHQRNVFSILLK